MPRQPIRSVLPDREYGGVTFGKAAAERRPELARLIGKCLMLWPYVESHMALILGQLLGAKDAAAISVFHLLRRSSAQRDAIWAAATFTLNQTDQELLSAILLVHKSTEKERNSLAHGYFGTSTKLPESLLWVDTDAAIALGLAHKLIKQWTFQTQKNLIDALYVQQREHLSRELQYRRLCDRSRIAEALIQLRQKNNSSTQPQSPQPDAGG